MSAAVSPLAIANLGERQQIDSQLSHLLELMSKKQDADEVLFGLVFHQNAFELDHVERLLVIASRLETYVRFRRQWRGR